MTAEIFPVLSRVTFAATGLNDATDANMRSDATRDTEMVLFV